MHSEQDQPGARMGVVAAILIGQLWVNVPVAIIMFGGFFGGIALFPGYRWVILLAVFIIAWVWWAFSVPRWRKWAAQKGAPAEALHRWAVLTGLEWYRGSTGSAMRKLK